MLFLAFKALSIPVKILNYKSLIQDAFFIYFETVGIDWYSIRISLPLINNKILAKSHMVII